MSLAAIALNLTLAFLLVCALLFGWRLERRLKALRDSHLGFVKAVGDLDTAARRAEQGLADLRAATDEATHMLGERIEKARALAAKLDKALAAPPPQDAPAARPSRRREEERPAALRPRAEPLQPLPNARLGARANLGAPRHDDDDLFEPPPAGERLRPTPGGRR